MKNPLTVPPGDRCSGLSPLPGWTSHRSVALGWGRWAVDATGEFSERGSLAEPGFASQRLRLLTNTSSGSAARECFVSSGAAGSAYLWLLPPA